jgi:hypothetical protein
VRSSVCENNRPFESARTVARPDIRMLNAARAPPQPVAHHENYFRESPAPATCPTTMEAGFAIIAWDVLIIGEELMPCYAPVISPEGDVVHASNHLWCVLCQRWVHYRGTVNHSTRHVRTHAEQRDEIQQMIKTKIETPHHFQ